MAGNIKLGLSSDTLQEYMLDDVRRRRRQLSNPMAIRLGTGGEFSDYENWALHVANDWREGVGKLAEDAAGYLYGEIESRVPEQLILPAALGCVPVRMPSSYVSVTTEPDETPAYMPAEAETISTLIVGGDGNPTRVSIAINLFGTITEAAAEQPRVTGVSFYGYVSNGVEVTAALYNDSSGSPGTQVASGTLTVSATQNQRPGFKWYHIDLSSAHTTAIDGNVVYHWVIYPTSSANQIQFVEGDTGPDSRTYSASTWSAVRSTCPFYLFDAPFSGYAGNAWRVVGINGFFLDNTDNSVKAIALAEVASTGYLTVSLPVEYDGATNVWDRVAVSSFGNFSSGYVGSDVGPAVVFDGNVYAPQVANMNRWTLATDAGATTSDDAALFAVWAGYIWRAYNNQLWYSADATTWTEVTGGVGGSDYRIRGLAGLGPNMYVSTDEALYYVAPGDAVVGVFPWGTISEENGRGMIAHQGAIYIPAAGRLWRFTEDGAIQDIWINRDDDLNARRLGAISGLASLNNMLVCGVNGTTSADPSSVWGYTGLGWHHMATLPPGYTVRSLYYDRVRSRLWIASESWAIFYIHAPDWALNPYNDSTSTYMPVGWIETDRIYAGSRELEKDVESWRAFGEFASGTSVAVYWRDQGSTDWELLGTADLDGEELRWSEVATRPATQWIRIGLLFQTTAPAATAKLRAWVLKVMPMVRDRWRWDLTVNVADNQQMIGGEMNDRYADEMRDALEGLITSVAPVLFEDVDGRQYWVKIMGAGESIDNYENDGYGDVRWSMKFNLSLEMIESVF